MPVKRGTNKSKNHCNRFTDFFVFFNIISRISIAFLFVVEGLPVQEASFTSPVWQNFFIKRSTALL